MLDEFIEEIEKLKSYKTKYEYAMAERQRMSDLLYDYMLKEYEATPYEERCKQYIDGWCGCCLHDCKNPNLPDNILMPIPNDNAWIPVKKTCGSFMWC